MFLTEFLLGFRFLFYMLLGKNFFLLNFICIFAKNSLYMKRVLLFLVLLFGILVVSDAQVYRYRTTDFAWKKVNSYGNWTNWSDWQDSDMLITINLNTDVVKVYSPETQTYRITKHLRNFVDNSGGKQAEYRFIDQDGDSGSMRLRVEKNGNTQLYIEFANIMWVYNVVRIE